MNCAVLRPHPKLAFDVNTTGTYNAIKSAVENGHSRFINTGPHFTVVGYTCTSVRARLQCTHSLSVSRPHTHTHSLRSTACSTH